MEYRQIRISDLIREVNRDLFFPRFSENSCGDMTELNDSSTPLCQIFRLVHFCIGNCNKRTNTNGPFMNLSMITTRTRHTIG